MSAELTRRAILNRAATLVAWLSWPFSVARARGVRQQLRARLPELAKSESAIAIGHTFLKMQPAEGDGDALHAWLEARLGPDWNTTVLAACNEADFANARTITIGGWVLAETEVRAFALAALL